MVVTLGQRSREPLCVVIYGTLHYLLHPRGVKFTSTTVAGDTPTNAELELAANWTRVWENKNVRIVAVTHNN